MEQAAAVVLASIFRVKEGAKQEPSMKHAVSM
jgi:hypothetical protein